MFRISRSSRRLPSHVNNTAIHWPKVLVILVIALYIGGAGQTRFVQAASQADETIDSFDISTSPIPNPACAHSLYEVQYFARVDRVVDLNGKKVNLEGGLGPSEVSIKAASSDTSIAEFHPETLTAKALDNRIGRGADFKLKTEAPGSATLKFTGRIKWNAVDVNLPPLEEAIKVVNCSFKITITSISSGFGPDIAETAVSTVTGEIREDENGTLTGTADVVWTMQQATPCLTAIQTVPPTQATLQGSLSGDGSQLDVRVNYDQAMLFQQNTITCAITATSHQQHQFQAPPLTFTVSTSGANISRPVSLQLGEMGLTGAAIISVAPIEGK